MGANFRDILSEASQVLPESRLAPNNPDAYKEITKSQQVSASDPDGEKVSDSVSGIVKRIPAKEIERQISSKYTEDPNNGNKKNPSSTRMLSSQTPIIGSVVSAIDSIKDQWTQQRTNWKLLVKGLSNASSDPRAAYNLMNRLMRKANGPVKVKPYYNDKAGNLGLVDILKGLGVDNLLRSVGLTGLSAGSPYTKKGYQETASKTDSFDAVLTKWINTKGECPMFKLGSNGSFASIFSGESFLGEKSNSLDAIAAYSTLADRKSSSDGSTQLDNVNVFGDTGAEHYPIYDYEGSKKGSQPSGKGYEKSILNYTELTDPYAHDGGLQVKARNPVDNIKYALQDLNALKGYDDFSGFSPRDDHNWSIRIYPYNPNREYPYSRGELRESSNLYYREIFTPPLPITYIPFWTVQKGKEGKEDFLQCNLKRFDWEMNTPVISYELQFGNLQNTSIDMGVAGKFEWAEYFNYDMSINVSIMDDVDATFSKYIANYFNKVFFKLDRARAPLEFSCFVIELVVFKPALKVNYMFRLIGQITNYQPDMEGSDGNADSNSLIRLTFGIVGIEDYRREGDEGKGSYGGNSYKQSNSSLDLDIAGETWNNVTMSPLTSKQSAENNDIVVNGVLAGWKGSKEKN